jgi:hypothetical protein
MPIEEPLERDVNPTRGQQTKWKKEKKVHLDVVKELHKIQNFERKAIEVEGLPTNLELTKLFTQLGGQNKGLPLGTTKEVNLPSGYKRLAKLTNRYAKLT